MANIEFRLRSDATSLRGEGPCILCHVLADTLNWGLGFTGSIESRWPKLSAKIEQRLRTAEPRPMLGDTLWTTVTDQLTLAHLIAERMGGPQGMELDRLALASCLERVGERAIAERSCVHAPPIGSGLSGACWRDVEPIVRAQLVERGIPVVIHCLGASIPG